MKQDQQDQLDISYLHFVGPIQLALGVLFLALGWATTMGWILIVSSVIFFLMARAVDSASNEKLKEKKAREEAEALEALSQQEEARQRALQDRAVAAIADHISTIIGAVRTLKSDKDNAMMLTTIDEDLAGILKEKMASSILDENPDLFEDLELACKMFEQSMVADASVTAKFKRLKNLT